MIVEMPKPIAAYFAADREDGETLSRCFTATAVVKDEGHTHHGRAAIRKWKDDAAAKYRYTNELIACEVKEGKVVVTNRIAGNFPGSPAELRFLFELEGDQIASLEVVP